MVKCMKDYNIGELIDIFIEEKKSYCEKKTIDYYNDCLINFCDYIKLKHNDLSILQLTRRNYINYIYNLRNKGVKNTTIRTYCRPVKVFVNYLVDENYMVEDITSKVKYPKNDEKVIIPLSVKEVNLVDEQFDLQKTGLRNFIMIHLMLDCGLRRSEVINLNVNDINVIDNLVIIRNSKNNKSRVLPLPEFLSLALLRYININDLSKSLFVMYDTRSRSMSRITENAIKNIFRKLKKVPGLERIHPHLLRHTFATSFVMGGGSMENLRILLGHSDYNITQNYLHISSQYLINRYPIYKLDGIFFNNYNK